MNKQEKKWQRIYDLPFTKTKPQKISKINGVSPSCPDINPLDYTIRDILDNETNATSHPNIGPLKTAIEEEWNKISEEWINKLKKKNSNWIKKRKLLKYAETPRGLWQEKGTTHA